MLSGVLDAMTNILVGYAQPGLFGTRSSLLHTQARIAHRSSTNRAAERIPPAVGCAVR